MIKVKTRDSYYEFYPDTKNWKRYPGPGASELEIDTGVYDYIDRMEVGQRMTIWLARGSQYQFINTSVVREIEDPDHGDFHRVTLP